MIFIAIWISRLKTSYVLRCPALCPVSFRSVPSFLNPSVGAKPILLQMKNYQFQHPSFILNPSFDDLHFPEGQIVWKGAFFMFGECIFAYLLDMIQWGKTEFSFVLLWMDNTWICNAWASGWNHSEFRLKMWLLNLN